MKDMRDLLRIAGFLLDAKDNKERTIWMSIFFSRLGFARTVGCAFVLAILLAVAVMIMSS